ncbi:MAG: hemolysin family protein [Methyloceanibacter sp.]|nr:hemolysin family protein [Methyloceanibacter sp.]
MSTPAPEREADTNPDRPAEDESTWFDRLLQTFGLSDEQDARTLIESALIKSKSDALTPEERSMMLRILRFGTLTVEDVMVPRADIVAVDDGVTIEDLLRIFRKSEHSRLPVYRETLDDPRGMIHIRDLMSWITEEANGDNKDRIDLGKVDLSRTARSIEIARELIYVPPSMSVLDLLLKMQTAQLHLALVVDEYGGTDGLVSIEDLVEEVVGEIADEHDVEDEPMLEKDAALGLVADARLPVEELEDYLGVDLVADEQEEDIDTLGGVVFTLAGRIPARGEVVGHPCGVEFEVLDADPRRIKRLRIHLPKGHVRATEESGSAPSES